MKRQTQRFRARNTCFLTFNQLGHECDELIARDGEQIRFQKAHAFRPVFTFEFTQGILLKLRDFIEHAQFSTENCLAGEGVQCNLGLLGSYEQATLESTYSSAFDTPSSARQLTMMHKLACLKKSSSIQFQTDEAISSSRCSETPHQRMMQQGQIDELTSSDVQDSSPQVVTAEVDLSGPLNLHTLPAPSPMQNSVSGAQQTPSAHQLPPTTQTMTQFAYKATDALIEQNQAHEELSDSINLKISQNTLHNLQEMWTHDAEVEEITRKSDDYASNPRGSGCYSLHRQNLSGISDTPSQRLRNEGRDGAKRYVRAPGQHKSVTKTKFSKGQLLQLGGEK